jgi:hypothetical protein
MMPGFSDVRASSRLAPRSWLSSGAQVLGWGGVGLGGVEVSETFAGQDELCLSTVLYVRLVYVVCRTVYAMCGGVC